MNKSFMKMITLTCLLAGAAASASAQQGATPGPESQHAGQARDRGLVASQSDPGYASYRRVVLGDTNVVVVENKTRCEDGRWMPGSYARYLIHNGTSDAEAVRQAQSIGERPEWVRCGTTQARPTLNGYELYQRAVLGVQESQILSNRGTSPPLQAQ